MLKSGFAAVYRSPDILNPSGSAAYDRSQVRLLWQLASSNGYTLQGGLEVLPVSVQRVAASCRHPRVHRAELVLRGPGTSLAVVALVEDIRLNLFSQH